MLSPDEFPFQMVGCWSLDLCVQSVGPDRRLIRSVIPFKSVSIRFWRALIRYGNRYDKSVETMHDLLQLTPDDLLEVQGVGKTTLWEIRDALAKHGLSLKGDRNALPR